MIRRMALVYLAMVAYLFILAEVQSLDDAPAAAFEQQLDAIPSQ